MNKYLIMNDLNRITFEKAMSRQKTMICTKREGSSPGSPVEEPYRSQSPGLQPSGLPPPGLRSNVQTHVQLGRKPSPFG